MGGVTSRRDPARTMGKPRTLNSISHSPDTYTTVRGSEWTQERVSLERAPFARDPVLRRLDRGPLSGWITHFHVPRPLRRISALRRQHSQPPSPPAQKLAPFRLPARTCKKLQHLLPKAQTHSQPPTALYLNPQSRSLRDCLHAYPHLRK